VAGGNTLSSLSVIHGATFHLTTRLDTEVREVATTFAVGASEFAMRLTLSGEYGGGGINALLFPMPDEVFLLVD